MLFMPGVWQLLPCYELVCQVHVFVEHVGDVGDDGVADEVAQEDLEQTHLDQESPDGDHTENWECHHLLIDRKSPGRIPWPRIEEVHQACDGESFSLDG